MYRPLSPGVFPKATLSLISGRMFTFYMDDYPLRWASNTKLRN